MPFVNGIYTGIANSFNDAQQGTVIDPLDWNALFTDIELGLNVLSKGTFATKTDVASASTCNIGAAATVTVRITGTTTITSLGSVADCRKYVYFAAALTLTHNATSLILPGGANIVTAAGDAGVFISDGSGNWRCWQYSRASGVVLAPPVTLGSAIGELSPGPATPGGDTGSPGTMGLDWIWSASSAARTQLINEGFIWNGKVAAGFGFAKNFDASHSSSVGYPDAFSGPNPAMILYAGNNGSNNDVTPLITLGNALASNTTVFGGNDIARSNGGGLTNVKLVGREIDMQLAAGDTLNAGSGALFINAFTHEYPVAIQFGGLDGGTFTNGVIVNNIVNCGFGAQTGAEMKWLMYTLNGTYSGNGAILLANGHKLGFDNPVNTSAATIRNDGSGNMLATMGTGGFWKFRNAADSATLMTIAATGQVGIGVDDPSANLSALQGFVVRNDSNTATRLAIVNANTGASTQSQLYQTTGTANSFVSQTLVDGAGTARFEVGGGSAVSGILSSFASHAWRSQAGAQWAYLANATMLLGVAGTITGKLELAGSTSGIITIQPQAAAGTFNFNLPTSAGTSGQPLLSGGGGSTAMSFGTLGVAAGGTGLTAGTSGGILYYSSTSALASSGALTANAIIKGGGAGSAPTASGVSIDGSNNVSGAAQVASSGANIFNFVGVNTSTAQFAGSGFALRGPSALGNQGGVAFFMANNNVGATEGYFAMIQTDTGGNYVQDLLKYNMSADVWTVATANTTRLTIGSGLQVGAPTGGDKGVGTINAVAVYDDNVLLTCYVFDQAVSGAISPQKWDALVPDRQHPAIADDKGRVLTPARIESRRHDPLRKFMKRLGTDTDPTKLEGYIKHWREKKHLTSMPNEASFNPLRGMSTGEWIQRLIETAELQALHDAELLERIKGLERQLLKLH